MTLNEELEAEAAKQARLSIEYLDITDKQSIAHMLFFVQGGRISCQRAASEIITRLNESIK